jgi:acetylornithine deacetylase
MLTRETTPSLASALEEKVVEAVASGTDELLALAGDLIACDTTARSPGDPPREEARLQRVLQQRLEAAGANVEVFEPEPVGPDNPFLDAALEFRGRPQLVAQIQGEGGGRSLLLNGHIDAVDIGQRENWHTDPFQSIVRDGLLYGRGSCDMKGGLACLEFALEILRRSGVRLLGDVVFCANTDEESSGLGGWSVVRHGVKAAGGICAEPSGFDVWTACHGCAGVVISLPGRAGHAELHQKHWSEGGAVNAIEKAAYLVGSLASLREEWRTRPDQQHPLLSPSAVIPTLIRGGNWIVTYPESAEITCDFQYLPHMAGAAETGEGARKELESWISAASAADPWLSSHRPTLQWFSNCPPAEVPSGDAIVTTALEAGRDIGRSGRVAGLDSWHDAATYTLYGRTPTVSFGPGALEVAHAIDEFVPVQDLVEFTAAAALIAMRWCGVAPA